MTDFGQKGTYCREKEKWNFEKWGVHAGGFDKEIRQVVCTRQVERKPKRFEKTLTFKIITESQK